MKPSKKQKISTKIKILGAAFIATILTIIISTIYLNQKNIKDSLIINIVGKERMLTQQIAKNIFYMYDRNTRDFTEIDNAVREFEATLNTLKNGDIIQKIESAPTKQIEQQILKITNLWKDFDKNVQRFKQLQVKNQLDNRANLSIYVDTIYLTNKPLLEEVDSLVTLYTHYMEQKTHTIKNFQYFGAFTLLLLIVYSVTQLRKIEAHANKFLEYSKTIIDTQVENEPIEYIKIDAEKEIVEASNTLNCFIGKINSAMQYSEEAVSKSQLASLKLEEITDEFDKLLYEINDSQAISSQISRSEDIAIQSSEDLLRTTKKLADLKQQLDSLLIISK